MAEPGGGIGSVKRRKNPVLAAFLAILPGVGALYNGNWVKAVTYLSLFAGMITILEQARSDEVVFALLLAAFYIFQIIDSFNEANRVAQGGSAGAPGGEARRGADIPLFSAILILLLGILFQLANLGVIAFADIVRMWPLLLIAMGLRVLFNHFRKQEDPDE